VVSGKAWGTRPWSRARHAFKAVAVGGSVVEGEERERKEERERRLRSCHARHGPVCTSHAPVPYARLLPSQAS
jgi:hypothetical protein